ncbi:hypothetical protein CGRA01v4_03579 [Colletotrichum graminicola]|nr:hypothetical protein CGRA01v4_03579 [Colletotrichum graminicola]
MPSPAQAFNFGQVWMKKESLELPPEAFLTIIITNFYFSLPPPSLSLHWNRPVIVISSLRASEPFPECSTHLRQLWQCSYRGMSVHRGSSRSNCKLTFRPFYDALTHCLGELCLGYLGPEEVSDEHAQARHRPALLVAMFPSDLP